MKISNKKLATIAIAVLAVTALSCYDKFDADSYNPPFTISGFTSSEEIAAANLVAYWPFDGSLTESITGLEATGVGTSFTGGFKGQALQGALNGYAITNGPAATSITSLTSFTLSWWMNTPPPSTGVIGIMSFSNQALFWGNLEVFLENGGSNTNGRLRTKIMKPAEYTFETDGALNIFDKWTNITLTYDATTGTFKMYANGSVTNTVVNAAVGNPTLGSAGKIVFGTTQFNTDPSIGCCGPQSWASYLTGQLDEVRLYNAVLTGAEVNALVILQGKGR